MATSIFKFMYPQTPDDFSEKQFEDGDVRRSVNGLFQNAFMQKGAIGIDAHMDAMVDAYIAALKKAERSQGRQPHAIILATHLAVQNVREIAFGVAPGLAHSPNHALGITSDMLFHLSRRLSVSPRNEFMWCVGATSKNFGMRFDVPNLQAIPEAVRRERTLGWWVGYPPPEGMAVVA